MSLCFVVPVIKDIGLIEANVLALRVAQYACGGYTQAENIYHWITGKSVRESGQYRHTYIMFGNIEQILLFSFISLQSCIWVSELNPLWLKITLQWRYNGRDCASNHQRLYCFLNRLFKARSKKTSKLRVTGLCEGNSPVTGEFPAQMASNAVNVSIWWRHHEAQYGAPTMDE